MIRICTQRERGRSFIGGWMNLGRIEMERGFVGD